MTEQLSALWQTAFGDNPEFIRLFFRTAYAPERCQYLTVEGQLAAALYWLDAWCGGKKLAYIYAVATHPDFRGRGLCLELMGRTHSLLAAQGYAGALLCPAGEGLRRMYTGMGYQDCGGISEFSSAAGEPVPLRRIGPEEYARLRRELLPEKRRKDAVSGRLCFPLRRGGFPAGSCGGRKAPFGTGTAGEPGSLPGDFGDFGLSGWDLPGPGRAALCYVPAFGSGCQSAGLFWIGFRLGGTYERFGQAGSL